MSRHRTQRGFTLIEMMVVVAIIAILGGLVISASSRPIGANARNSASTVVSMLSFAKLRASSTRRVQRIQIQTEQVSVWSAPTTGLIPGTGTWDLIQNKGFNKGIKVFSVVAGAVTTTGASITEDTALAGTPAVIDVRPDGQATASTVYITDGKDKYRVLVYHATGGSYARAGW